MKLRPFELGLLIGFLVLMVLALIFMKTYKPSTNSDVVQIGAVDIWGTLPKDGMDSLLREMAEANEQYRRVTYRYVDYASFQSELANAIAEGRGPDMLMLSSEQIVSMRTKIRPVSFESYPLRDIQNRYLDGAQIFALKDGLYAYPIMVDPLVMFWNKDMLATNNFLTAPATWESLVNEYHPVLTKRANDRTIEKSTVALGEFDNIKNANAIFSAMLIQAGSQGVVESSQEGFYSILLNKVKEGYVEPVNVVMDFYTRFARPDNSLYSWNRSFSSDIDRFVSGDSALYLGLGSEGVELEKLNPNLTFDIAEIPQGATATLRRTYGRFYGLSLLKSSDNLPGAAVVLRELSTDAQMQKISEKYSMVPASRGIVATGSNDRYGRVTYKSAIIAYGWLQPDKQASDKIFSTAVREVIENRNEVSVVVNDALDRLELEYNK